MNSLFKALTAFIVSSMLLLTISLPDKGSVVNYVNSSISTIEYNFVGDFYHSDAFTKTYLEPVVKLNYEALTPYGPRVITSATGFSVEYDKKEGVSYIVTNNHFCDVVNEVSGRFFFEDRKVIMSAEIQYDSGSLTLVDTDPSKDLCLLKTEKKVRPVKLASRKYSYKQMEEVITVGGPKGVFPIIRETRISNLFSRDIAGEEMMFGPPFLMLSDLAFGGQSGSPVYNKKGEVVGVLFMNLSDFLGPIYGSAAIPIQDLRDFLDKNRI